MSKIWTVLLSLLISSQALAFPELTDKTFYKTVSSSKGYVVVDFYATWCGACKLVHPMLEDIAKKHPNVKFYQMDAEKEGNASTYFRVHYYPTILVFKDGGDPTEVYASREEASMEKQLKDIVGEKK